MARARNVAAGAFALAFAVVVLASRAGGQDRWPRCQVVPTGAANSGAGALVCPMGDVLNVRGIQGGYLTGRRRDLNLDIGAGSAQHRGTILLQPDVGDGRVLFFDGHGHRVFAVGPRNATFYVPVRFRRRPVARAR